MKRRLPYEKMRLGGISGQIGLDSGRASVAGYRFRTYPAHPALIRSFAHQARDWSMEKRGGDFSPTRGCSSQVGGFGGRPCAVFEFVGESMDKAAARNMLGNAI